MEFDIFCLSPRARSRDSHHSAERQTNADLGEGTSCECGELYAIVRVGVCCCGGFRVVASWDA